MIGLRRRGFSTTRTPAPALISVVSSPPVSSGSQPPAAISRLPFTDSFESGNTGAWDVTGGVVSIVTTERYGSGTRSASTLATLGQQSDNYLEYNFGDAPSVGGTPTGMNDLWIRFAHKWASDYIDSDAAIIAQKLLLLNAHNPATGRRRYQVTFNVFNNGSYFFDIYRWNEDTSFGGTIHSLTLPTFTRVKGRWEEFVIRVRMNTPGTSDGHLDCWTKAEGDASYSQQLSRTNLNMRDATAITPNRLIGLSNYDTLTTRSGRRYWDSMYIGQTAVDMSTSWEDVTVGYSAMPAQLGGADGRKVRLRIDSSGSDWGAQLGTGASATRIAGGAFDGTDSIRLVPPTIGDNYACILRFLDLSNGGAKDSAQCNLGFCLKPGPRYWDLGHQDKLTGILGSQTVGGETDARLSRAAVFDAFLGSPSDLRRIFSITATTVACYFQPAAAGFPEHGPDPRLLMILGTTANHAADPPQVNSEWLYFEQEVDYRRDRGNADGRNRLDVWARDGYLGYLEIPLTWRELAGDAWDFSFRYARAIEYVGAYWNQVGTPNAGNHLEVSHAIVSVNRAKDARIGPPPGFLL